MKYRINFLLDGRLQVCCHSFGELHIGFVNSSIKLEVVSGSTFEFDGEGVCSIEFFTYG